MDGLFATSPQGGRHAPDLGSWTGVLAPPLANGDASRDDARAVDSVLTTRRNRTSTAGKGGNHGD